LRGHEAWRTREEEEKRSRMISKGLKAPFLFRFIGQNKVKDRDLLPAKFMRTELSEMQSNHGIQEAVLRVTAELPSGSPAA
jgi:hypothetical protein